MAAQGMKDAQAARSREAETVLPPALPVEPEKPLSYLEKANAIRVVGEVFSTYILVEGEGEMMLIDKHAAHERMIYNRLEHTSEGTSPQVLLIPETVNLSRREKEALLGEKELLQKAGFEVEDFGDGAVILRQVPMYLEKRMPGLCFPIWPRRSSATGKTVPSSMKNCWRASPARLLSRRGPLPTTRSGRSLPER